MPDDGDDKLKAMDRQIHITAKDMKSFGYTKGCPRCNDLSRGRHRTTKGHSLECRLRIYKRYGETDDPKYRAFEHLFESQSKDPALPEDLDPSGHLFSDDVYLKDLLQSSSEPRPSASVDAPQTAVDEPNLEEAWDWEDLLGDSSGLDGNFLGGGDVDDDMDNGDAMVDAFILAGANDLDAKIHVSSMLNFIKTSASAPITFMDVFGGGAICHEANTTRRNLNLDGRHPHSQAGWNSLGFHAAW